MCDTEKSSHFVTKTFENIKNFLQVYLSYTPSLMSHRNAFIDLLCNNKTPEIHFKLQLKGTAATSNTAAIFLAGDIRREILTSCVFLLPRELQINFPIWLQGKSRTHKKAQNILRLERRTSNIWKDDGNLFNFERQMKNLLKWILRDDPAISPAIEKLHVQ